MLALVLAAFVLMSATFVVTLAAFVLMGAFVSAFAAGLLTGLHFAAVLGTLVDAGLAVVGSASGVGASALVVAIPSCPSSMLNMAHVRKNSARFSSTSSLPSPRARLQWA